MKDSTICLRAKRLDYRLLQKSWSTTRLWKKAVQMQINFQGTWETLNISPHSFFFLFLHAAHLVSNQLKGKTIKKELEIQILGGRKTGNLSKPKSGTYPFSRQSKHPSSAILIFIVHWHFYKHDKFHDQINPIHKKQKTKHKTPLRTSIRRLSGKNKIWLVPQNIFIILFFTREYVIFDNFPTVWIFLLNSY